MTLAAPAFEAKLVPADDADALQRRLAALPRPMVFTNGVFDILHRGHATYLAQARALGACLVVGVNSDASVRMLGKGDDRPLNTEADRMALLAALASVDLVVMFREKTPVELLRQVRPDIYVKGGDYDIDTLEETRLVRGWGGEACAIPFLHDRSTTKLLHKVRQSG
ncbi:rfaE bifunctional protein nucleotidyltransferase chain/domain [Cupriavidus gilardii J11]|uniref:D-glycero-beta-D-manno-heptose 1-phosphate adenylyltransferase n=1 Tax=Cupriavidus gilardii J11 TaxID=936133 RepID=A0A562BJG7_9BURK|nr:D-glycero-beta-D-manno-heptose 1-phosphate adenylyltransferase [Cupriavidus gilardii]TWG85272.1 rfaE bifunctional protein nucleotidyltransferase chain/domain [Cupriavidus gilardii J11]